MKLTSDEMPMIEITPREDLEILARRELMPIKRVPEYLLDCPTPASRSTTMLAWERNRPARAWNAARRAARAELRRRDRIAAALKKAEERAKAKAAKAKERKHV